jgi:molybdopterin molybdotransferase
MLSVSEAQAIVLQHAQALPAAVCALDPASVQGLILAEDITSDLDLPPYDKAMMDGYAVRTADLPGGAGTLEVIEEIMAGRVPTKSVGAGQTARIMTGAPVPEGADAVIQIERTKPGDKQSVVIQDAPPRAGKNILPLGREMRRGETVLRAGAVLRPEEFGLLAAVGRTSARVFPAPRVAILATGDELVDASRFPGPGQIRNSNGPMLIAQVCRAHGRATYLGIAADTIESLTALITEGLKSDVLVLSGGVSAGKLDLVPGVLQDLGVEAHFHKVTMKPGKPVFFGTRGQTLIFGLPGNPVSSLVCFELFVRPALRRLAGNKEVGPRIVHAALQEELRHQSDRPTYHPAVLIEDETGRKIRAQPWFGSPDLKAVTSANAFLVLPAGEHRFAAGERLPALLVDAF